MNQVRRPGAPSRQELSKGHVIIQPPLSKFPFLWWTDHYNYGLNLLQRTEKYMSPDMWIQQLLNCGYPMDKMEALEAVSRIQSLPYRNDREKCICIHIFFDSYGIFLTINPIKRWKWYVFIWGRWSFLLRRSKKTKMACYDQENGSSTSGRRTSHERSNSDIFQSNDGWSMFRYSYLHRSRLHFLVWFGLSILRIYLYFWALSREPQVLNCLKR